MKTLSKLNQRASKTFEKLTAGLTKVGDHRKIDNAPGAFMALCIEVIEDMPAGKVVSLAHYFEQCGDLMADPEVCLLVSNGRFTGETGIYPLSFRQDNLGIDRQVATVQEDGHIVCYPRQQRDLTLFVNQWLKNVEDQQF